MSKGRYGIHGGQYISETLMNELIHLEECYEYYKKDPEFNAELTELLNSYPDVTSSLLHRVEAAGGSGITIQFTDYNASTGELLFNANSSQVIDIPAYIRSLQNCGVFSTVSYTGYKADDDGYSIDLRCVLAAPQQ